MRFLAFILFVGVASAQIARTTYRTEEGATVGPNVVLNGNFASDTNWTKPTGGTISGGKANWTQDGNFRQNTNLEANAFYEFIYNVSDYTSGSINAQGWNDTAPSRSCYGTFRDVIQIIQGPTSALFIHGGSGFVGSVSNITVRKITPVVVNWNPRVVAITGDSIAQHQAVTYPSTYPGNTASGFSLAQDDITPRDCALGNTTYHWTATNGILQCIASNAPTIIVHDGVNDNNTGRTWANILADLNDIRASVSNHQDLFFDEILPWPNGTDSQNATNRAWNTNLAVWCATNNAHLISSHDLMGKLRVSTGQLDDLLLANDGVHPGAGGEYVLWSIWFNALEAFYGVPIMPVPPTIYANTVTVGTIIKQ
jgi:hypothetical protein